MIHHSKSSIIKFICLINSSATPIKLFNGVANLISPFKENQSLYNNSPMKINIDFGNPLGSKKIFIYTFC